MYVESAALEAEYTGVVESPRIPATDEIPTI